MSIRSRRFKEWRTLKPAANTLTAGTGEISQFTADPGETVIRLILDIQWRGVTVDTNTRYVAGIITAPATVDADDISPFDNPELDWMWWYGAGSNNPAYDGVDSFVGRSDRFDIRSARRVEDGEALFYSEESEGNNVISIVNLRALVLLP